MLSYIDMVSELTHGSDEVEKLTKVGRLHAEIILKDQGSIMSLNTELKKFGIITDWLNKGIEDGSINSANPIRVRIFIGKLNEESIDMWQKEAEYDGGIIILHDPDAGDGDRTAFFGLQR